MNFRTCVTLLIIGLLASCTQQNTDKQKASAAQPPVPKPVASQAAPNTQTPITKKLDKPAAKAAPKAPAKNIITLNWDDLIPLEAQPDPKVVEQYNNGEIDDDDPKMKIVRQKIKDLEEKAPVNTKLNGKTIKIPGFLVPVELDGEKVKEFLLVPYQGACIHVPPPPANQTIYVKSNPQSVKPFHTFDTVWVTGDITVQKQKHDLADTGFTINSANVELYE